MSGSWQLFAGARAVGDNGETDLDCGNSVMGLGFRIFFVNDDDSLQRTSLAKYERLYREDSNERLPQYAGKRVRCAVVVLLLEDRKPQSIARIDCNRILFDTEGRVDLKEWESHAQLIGHFLDIPIAEQDQDNVIDAQSVFARKRYKREAKWPLTPEIEGAIEEAIFGSGTDFPRIV